MEKGQFHNSFDFCIVTGCEEGGEMFVPVFVCRRNCYKDCFHSFPEEGRMNAKGE